MAGGHEVAGSNRACPTSSVQIYGEWCSGNTSGSEPEDRGSESSLASLDLGVRRTPGRTQTDNPVKEGR